MKTMPQYAKVQIHYGPYEAAGIVEHRTSRLEGLQSKIVFTTFSLHVKYFCGISSVYKSYHL